MSAREASERTIHGLPESLWADVVTVLAQCPCGREVLAQLAASDEANPEVVRVQATAVLDRLDRREAKRQ